MVQMDVCLTFNCNGKVNFNDWELSKDGLFSSGEVENVLYPRDEHLLSDVDIQLFECTVSASTVLLDLKHYIKCMDMQLKILCRHESYSQVLNSTIDNTDFYYIRCTVSEFVSYIRAYLNSIKWDLHSLLVINEDIENEFNALFDTMKRFLNRLRSIPDATFHYAPSKLGNQCTQPEYHMYHMHIELRWLFISLMYTRNTYCQYSMENQLDEFENIQKMIINDLIYISLKVFETVPLVNLQQKTPYNCTCIRELWLMFQVFTDNLSERMKSKTFWDYVNDCMDELFNRNVSDSKQEPRYQSLIPCKNSELFCLWIIYNLSLLYGYNNDGVYLGSKCSRIKPNYEQLEKILKTYISKGGKDGERDAIDEELRIMIPLLSTIVINWWQPRVSIISLLWDCFHKRLDEPFLLQATGPWTLSVEKKTATDILKQVKDRINNVECVKESSYGMFLRLLGSFLRINYSNSDIKHWNQIKSRIYSKFSKSKVQEFTITGLYNFISLFLTLAITADTTNVCTVMLDLLPAIREYNSENSKKYILIWKGKLTVLLLYNDLKLNLTSIASLYIDTVNTVCCRKDDTSRSMMSNFVDVFGTVLSSCNMELGEHLLLSGWIDRYLLECPNKIVGTLTRKLINVFDKCVFLINTNSSNTGLDGVEKMLVALWCYVACRVRQLVFDPALTSDHYRDIAKLAVAFTLEALRNPTIAKKHKHSAMSLFQHFASSIIVKDIRITRYYLMLILERKQAIQDLKKEIKNFDTVIVQAWIKCSIIGHNTNGDEIKILQNYVSQLSEIQQMFETSNDIQEFQTSRESVLIFMMHAMKKRNILKTEQERIQYDIKWKQYFNHIEKWILTPVTEETNDSELALWIYRCIGTLILCTSTMLYSKNQPNNMFKILLNKTILSVEQPFLKNLGKKTFSMILLGIETLNVKSDISLQVLIRDLFDQYMTLLITPITNTNNFKVSDSLLKCFKDAKADFIHLIFEILVTNFFTITNDNLMHKHSYLVMIILQNLLKGEKNYPCHIIEYIILICSPHIFGCYIKVHDHHPHKQQTIDFINNVTRNSYYKENRSLQNKLNNVISSVVQKSLISNQHNTFELLRSILPAMTDIVQFLSPQIENILSDLEKNRRPNAASFRYSWNQLENIMKNMKKNQ
ncbi:protein MMS22-like isoform X3 [Osmia bicornis bicornis]|uniref:protein MMS22-like isoform X3 n=1 Tax=Osmia bicornis bicornis TaxID=1437191 RepID=UPI001EAF5FEF|nr:protein MMS22-like isoform X3 [Osmia bicornis bicornis]